MGKAGGVLASLHYLQPFAAVRSYLQLFADIPRHLRADPCCPWTLSDEGI
ncbi:hypothetical protein MHB56_26630 [Paenibacillus sp. FSL H8-0315]